MRCQAHDGFTPGKFSQCKPTGRAAMLAVHYLTSACLWSNTGSDGRRGRWSWDRGAGCGRRSALAHIHTCREAKGILSADDCWVDVGRGAGLASCNGHKNSPHMLISVASLLKTANLNKKDKATQILQSSSFEGLVRCNNFKMC